MSVYRHASMVTAAFALMLTSSIGAADTIKIGMNVPLTGFAAADGASARHGAEIAVARANAEGGINGKEIVLVVYDDQASPKTSVPVASKLIEKDKVPIAISGSYSAPTRAAAGVFQDAGIPYISAYAVHPDITRAGPYVFRTSFVGEVQGRAAAKFIGEDIGKKKIVITVLKNDYGKSLARGFKEVAGRYGIRIVGEYEYSIKDRQFGPIVASVRSDDPEALYDTGYWFVSGPLVSQLRAAGIDVPIVGQEGYDSQKFIEIAGDAAEGVMITTSLNRDSKAPITRKFIAEFEHKAGYPADMVAASGNTAALVAIAALRKAGSEDPSAIRDAIASLTLEAPTGSISFNALGEVRKNVQIQVVKDGAWRHHSIIDDDALLAPPMK